MRKPFEIDDDNCLGLVKDTGHGYNKTLVAQYISDEAVSALMPVADRKSRRNSSEAKDGEEKGDVR